jgi:hypothetical protein
MSDERRHHFQLKLHRKPVHGLDLSDEEGVREHLLSELAHEVASTAAVRPLLIFLTAAHRETLDLGPASTDVEKETVLVATFQKLGQREGVARSFRQGELRLAGADGRLRRAACLLEWLGGEGWWLATRFFGTGQAGVGVQHGDWQRSQGSGLEALNEAVRAWLDVGSAELERLQQTETIAPAPKPDFQMAFMQFKAPMPEDLPALAQWLCGPVDRQLLVRGLDCLRVLLARKDGGECWEIRGELPCAPDDLVRALAAMGSAPDAAALVGLTTVEMPDGVTRRAVAAVVERGGRRITRLLPLDLPDGGQPRAFPPLYLPEQDVPNGEGWIGVPTTVSLNLSPEMWGAAPVADA